jgi:ABC-2 type transport system ATP-binding protein
MDEPVFRVESLTHVYPGRRARGPVVANEDLSFEVRRGQVFGLLGPNGAGKTTLVRQLAGLLAPTRGTVTLLGASLGESPRHFARYVAYMGQRPSALGDLTPEEAIAVTGRLRGLSPKNAAVEAGRIVDELGLFPYARRRISRLSGGESRLSMLGVALAGSRPVLVLDEPTAELDPGNRRRVWEVLRRVQSERGTTIVLVTHNVSEAETVFDEVVIMHRGRFLVKGSAAEVKARMAGRLRVEIVVPAEHVATPSFGDLVEDLRVCGRRRYVGWGDRVRAGEIVDVLSKASLDDFSVGTPTLEDLFLLVGGEGELAA